MKHVFLTPRQSQVVRLLALGMSYDEIGEALHISGRTVEHHAAIVRAKTGSASNAAAVSRARGGAGPRALGPRSED